MRYYFHLRIGDQIEHDEVGLELPDLETAYLEAFETARAMWAELLAARRDPMVRAFDIADDTSRVVLTVPFSEVLERAQTPRSLPSCRQC